VDVTGGAVETSEQLAVLRDLGCDRAQGRHLAPPLTVEELERLLHMQAQSESGITLDPDERNDRAPLG
jgi:EAL domain-containing protein (putative c-di-GMP-specific phosphodiesterase class I)